MIGTIFSIFFFILGLFEFFGGSDPRMGLTLFFISSIFYVGSAIYLGEVYKGKTFLDFISGLSKVIENYRENMKLKKED